MIKRAATQRQLTMDEHLERHIDALYRLRELAANGRRRHRETEDLLDGLDRVGKAISKLGRG